MKILNFRNTSTLFLLLFSLFTVCRIIVCPGLSGGAARLCSMPFLVYSTLLIFYMGVSVIMAFFPASGFHYRDVSTHGNRERKTLTLTFDDGPDAETTTLILDILQKYKLSAAFFIIGEKIEGNEGIIKRMVSEGHIIGNHSWSHSYLWDFYPSVKMANEIERTIRETEKFTGKRMKLFRPPYGVINPLVAKALVKTGVKTVAWSFRSFDTAAMDPLALLAKTIIKTSPGDVMLFHDNCRLTAGILEKIIVSLQERGFTFIPLDEMLNLQAYENF